MSTLELDAKPRSPTIDETIGNICRDLAGLDPGPLADLRRMDTTSDRYGAPFFWRLRSRYDLGTSPGRELKWAQVVQALAILTPKGRDEHKPSRHARRDQASDARAASPDGQTEVKRPSRRSLGHVLCDGADPGWPEDPANPRPLYSETRLAQLLGSSGETRVDLAVRVARFLAVRLPADVSFDCTDIARLLLYPDDASVGRKIARDYYARLDSTRRTEQANDTADANSPGDET